MAKLGNTVSKYATMAKLEQLEAFIAIARAGSISKAATNLSSTKSAMSRRLSDLEARLGAQLITRTTRQLALTDAGAEFLKRAERILDELSEAENFASGNTGDLQGRLRVAAPLSFGLARLKPVVSSFISEHPGLTVEVDLSDRTIDLVEEGIDVALRIGVLPDSSMIARKVVAVSHIAAASPAFWDQHSRPQNPQALESLPCLQYANLRQPGQLFFKNQAGEKGSIAPTIKLLANNGDFLTSLAVEGHGYLVEPDFILERLIQTGELEPVLEDYQWSEMHLYLVYPPTRNIAAKTRAFSEAVMANFAL